MHGLLSLVMPSIESEATEDEGRGELFAEWMRAQAPKSEGLECMREFLFMQTQYIVIV